MKNFILILFKMGENMLDGCKKVTESVFDDACMGKKGEQTKVLWSGYYNSILS